MPEKEIVSFTGSSHIRSMKPYSRSSKNSSSFGGVKSAVCTGTINDLFTSTLSRGLFAMFTTDDQILRCKCSGLNIPEVLLIGLL